MWIGVEDRGRSLRQALAQYEFLTQSRTVWARITIQRRRFQALRM